MIYALPNGTIYDSLKSYEEQEQGFIKYVENEILNDYSLIVESESKRELMGKDFQGINKYRYDLAVFNKDNILKVCVKLEYRNSIHSNASGSIKKVTKTIQIL